METFTLSITPDGIILVRKNGQIVAQEFLEDDNQTRDRIIKRTDHLPPEMI